MIISLAAIGGVVIAIADDRLRRRLPEVTATTGSSVVFAYRAVVGVGLLFVPLAVGGYFTTESSSYRPPAEVGIALLVVGLATIAGRAIRVQRGSIVHRTRWWWPAGAPCLSPSSARSRWEPRSARSSNGPESEAVRTRHAPSLHVRTRISLVIASHPTTKIASTTITSRSSSSTMHRRDGG